MIILSLVSPLLLGCSFYQFFHPKRCEKLHEWFLCFVFSLAIGLGMTSVLFSLWMLFLNTHTNYPIFEIIITVIVSIYYIIKKSNEIKLNISFANVSMSNLLIFFIFLFVFISLTYIFTKEHPHGAGDGISIWNTKARFIYREGSNWKSVFSKKIALSHPDYPLFLPLSVARGWTIIGHEDQKYPMLLSGIFSSLTILVIFSFFSLYSNSVTALFSALILVGTPFFLIAGASQCADIPFALFMVLVLISWLRRENIFLISILIGFCIFTKKEGILFSSCFFVSLLLFQKNKSKVILQIFPGVIFFLILTQGVKMIFSDYHGGDFIFIPSIMAARLIDFSRIKLVFHVFKFQIERFGEWHLSFWPILVVAALISIVERKTKIYKNTIFIGFIIFTMLACYALIFLTASRFNLQWHMDTSLNRLLVALWPAFILWFFFDVQN